MPKKIEENIENFFDAIKNIKENTDKINSIFLRYPIYFILLDVLSQYAFPNEEKVGKRFINFIDTYSNWEYKNYVSVLLLNDLLVKEKNKECFTENEDYKDLEKKVNETKNIWGQEGECKILNPKEADLTIEELENFREERYWKLIKICRYPSIIYQIRNYMIHNLRFPKPKDPLDTTNIEEPYYYILDDSYELCIPDKIVPMFVEKCSKNLKEKVMQEVNKYDPKKIFKIMPDWFHKLPKPKKCY